MEYNSFPKCDDSTMQRGAAELEYKKDDDHI